MRKRSSIEPSRLSSATGSFFIFLAAVVLGVSVYSWLANGSVLGLTFGLFFSAVLLGIAWFARQQAGADRLLEQINTEASHGGEVSAQEIDEQLGTPPPLSDREIRPGGPLARDR